MDKKQYRVILVLGTILLAGLCLGLIFATLGSGLTLWFALDRTVGLSTPTPRIIRRVTAISVSTPTVSVLSNHTPTSPLLTPTSASTPTPLPTTTLPPTATSLPPTPTPIPPTRPPTSTEARSIASPTLTATPTPSFAFAILETEQFPTNHLDFDVFIAVTDTDNIPLAGYRVIGYHNSGLEVESQLSANDWTVNSGAMHYKAGNIKYSVPNSPDGLWTLQLINEAGNSVAPTVELPYDTSSPTWYFVLYAHIDP